jgi:hypothetical protein
MLLSFSINYLRGAALNVKHFDLLNNSARFPSIDSQVCLIAKNGHAAIQYVSCLLAAIQMGDGAAVVRLNSYKSTFAGHFTTTCEALRPVWAKESDDMKKIVFIRDPLERFISGWLFVCKK